MDFIIIFAAMIANVITAKIFKPYTHWAVAFFNWISECFEKKPYKKVFRLGTFFTIMVTAILLISVDLATAALFDKSYVYRYIVYGFTVYFTVCVGQVTNILSKLSKNLHNEDYVSVLMGEFLISDWKDTGDVNSKKIFVRAFSRVLAEKIIMPLLLIMILGPGVTLAYSFVNTLARSDFHQNVKTHGFADFAIKLNDFVSIPAYMVTAFALFVANWVLGIKIGCKIFRFVSKCETRLSAFENSKNLSPMYIKMLKWLTPGIAFLVAFAVLCAYIFAQAVFAGIGLGDYIDYWNKDTAE